MKQPDIPANEQMRLQTLRAYAILDTPPEDELDRFTRLAKKLFNVPIALISLVDENRQWFKSCIGLNVSETPRDISFCGHTILNDAPFIIPNTLKDDRFKDNPLVVSAPHIRFYAGCPLAAHNGDKLGTLCIIDRKPRRLSISDVQALADLSAMVEHQLNTQQLATMDELTNSLNRRGFTEFAQHSLSLCIRERLAASLIFIDLNNFKAINDTYGHAEGDSALVLFSQLLQRTFRDSDIIARLGGDEFVVLLTNNKQMSEDSIKRLRNAINQFNSSGSKGYELSFAYGIVEFDVSKHKTLADLLHNGDKLMYQQKENAKTIE